jgi:nucleoside 2-deoxyribosyltransferase
MKIYIAGPLTGRSSKEALDSFKRREKVLKSFGYKVLSPLYGKPYLYDSGELKAGGYDQPVSTDSAIFQRDHWSVELADIVYLDFTDASKVSIGSCFEMAWASHLGKKVVVAGLTPDNPMSHAFVRQATSLLFDTTQEAEDYLKSFAGHYELPGSDS